MNLRENGRADACMRFRRIDPTSESFLQAKSTVTSSVTDADNTNTSSKQVRRWRRLCACAAFVMHNRDAFRMMCDISNDVQTLGGNLATLIETFNSSSLFALAILLPLQAVYLVACVIVTTRSQQVFDALRTFHPPHFCIGLVTCISSRTETRNQWDELLFNVT